MSKRDVDGDVLANRVALGEAKGRKFLASLLGPPPTESTGNASINENEDDDLKQNFGHDRLGVGGILPKDIADGSFTRRAPTSNDKLLEQLLGKKKAKAHLAAKAEAARPSAKNQRQGRPVPQKKEESEDEEEGRAGAFRSKRSKKNPKPAVSQGTESDNEDEETRAARLGKSVAENSTVDAAEIDINKSTDHVEVIKTGADIDSSETVSAVPKKGRAKPKSFLDEILAERSKKKKSRN